MLFRSHSIEYDEIDGRFARNITLEGDLALGRLFGLSEAELDFIVNYDIKYRMAQADRGLDD